MKRNICQWYSFRGSMLLLGSMLLILSYGCKKINENSIKELKHFEQVNLVGNNNEYQPRHVDPLLINAWGIAFNTTGIAWVNAEDGHVSAVYDKEGVSLRPPVNIPSPGGVTGGTPTGIVFNSSNDFELSNGAPARFIFVGVDGILSGWNPGANNNALVIEDNSATSAYTGLTMAQNGGANYLYAADFRAGKIQVWDMDFKGVSMPFWDPQIPAGYAPFNIQAADGLLYVTYAEVGEEGEEEIGPGKGFVDVYNTDGSFVERLATRGVLNAPWGVAIASTSFFNDNDEMMKDLKSKNGGHQKDQSVVLIGNFGDGTINVFTRGGIFIGQLKHHGKPIEIEGLWAITFPPATATTIDPDRLYFAAGPDDEEEGLFGYIIKDK
jgi:uncharacterized protein (TIGR03118 family)